jgi:hypothetical protein
MHLDRLFERTERVLTPQEGALPTYSLLESILRMLYNGYVQKKYKDTKLDEEAFDYPYFLSA